MRKALNAQFEFIRLDWVYDCIDYGIMNHIDHYKLETDKESEENFLKKKWFLKSIFPLIHDEREFDLNKNFLRIGRDDNNEIEIPSKKISKVACELRVCQNKWRLAEYPENKNGIFLFKDNSYKRVKGLILKEGDIISFGGGNNIPYGNCVTSLKRKVITFEFSSEEDLKENIKENSKKVKELENQILVLKEKNEIYKETLRRRDLNLKEVYPSCWKDKKIIAIVDANVFIKHGVRVFDILKKHCILIPRASFNEMDNLKDKGTLSNNEAYALREVTRYILTKNDKNIFIPSIDVTHYILNNMNVNKDEEIAMNANYYQKKFKKKKVVIVTKDHNMMIRSNSSNILATDEHDFTKQFGY